MSTKSQTVQHPLPSTPGVRRGKTDLQSLIPILLISFGLGTLALHAQVDQGTITGIVSDTTGAFVPNATITIINIDTGFRYSASSDASGVYMFPMLKTGHYDISASATGFSPSVVKSVPVQVNQRQAVDFVLKVGGINETIEVSSNDVPVLQTLDASNAQAFSSEVINQTPLNGRNYVFIAQFAAGAPPTADGRGGANGDFNANGQRPEQNNFVLDGVDNNSSSADILNSTSYSVKPPPDALSEFKVQTISYDAQLGHSAGAVVNAAIKSGTNALHGDLWEYLRNDAFDAAQFNSQANLEYRQNQFGATIGGPIVHNHLFFFADAEANRIVYGSPVFATVPTAAMRSGDFSELLNTSLTGQPQPITLYAPGSSGVTAQTCSGRLNVFCAGQISSVAQTLLSLYPLPNTNGGKVYNNYEQSTNAVDNTAQWDGRVDWNVSEKDRAFARMSYSNDLGSIPPPLGPILDGGNFGGDNLSSKVESIAVSETHIFNPRFVNEFRVGENLMVIEHTQFSRSQDLSTRFGLGGIPFSSGNGGLPGVSISGIAGFGSPLFYPALQHDNTFQLLDNVTRIVGNHSLRMGGDFQRVRFSYLEQPAPRGYYSYSGTYTGQPGVSYTGYGVADFLADYQNSALLSELSNVDQVHWYLAGYFQDDWIVNRRIALNLGLRYDYFQPYVSLRDRQSNFVPLSLDVGTGTGVFLLPSKWSSLPLDGSFHTIASQNNFPIQYTSNRALSTSSKANFSPRIGLSFRATDRLVVRTGFGMFYGGLENVGSTLGTSYPFDATLAYLPATGCSLGGSCPTNGITLPIGFSNLPKPGPSSPVSFPYLAGRPLHYHDGYTEEWNLTTQYAITKNLGLTVGYVGALGRHMQDEVNLNSPAALAFPGTNMQPYTPFPLLGGAFFDNYAGESAYHALQASVEKRFSSGLDFLSSYTWGHSIDNGPPSLSSLLGVAEWRNPVLIPLKYEFANSPSDVRHRITFLGAYQLPFGSNRRYLNQNKVLDQFVGRWSVALTFAAQTGTPITISPNIVTAAGGSAHAIRIGDPFKGGGQPNSTNPGITCPTKVRTVTHWFNPCAFANPLPGASITGLITDAAAAIRYLGPPRDQIDGPGLNNTNISLFKSFNTFREQSLQFRVDVFNVFNTPAYANPADLSINSNSGYILTTRSLGAYTPDSRFFQFALKYYF
jgi:hypothetical protein